MAKKKKAVRNRGIMKRRSIMKPKMKGTIPLRSISSAIRAVRGRRTT